MFALFLLHINKTGINTVKAAIQTLIQLGLVMSYYAKNGVYILSIVKNIFGT